MNPASRRHAAIAPESTARDRFLVTVAAASRARSFAVGRNENRERRDIAGAMTEAGQSVRRRAAASGAALPMEDQGQLPESLYVERHPHVLRAPRKPLELHRHLQPREAVDVVDPRLEQLSVPLDKIVEPAVVASVAGCVIPVGIDLCRPTADEATAVPVGIAVITPDNGQFTATASGARASVEAPRDAPSEMTPSAGRCSRTPPFEQLEQMGNTLH